MAQKYGTMTKAASDQEQHQHQSHSNSSGAERHSTDESPLLNHGPHHNLDIGHGNEVGPSAGFWSCVSLFSIILHKLISSHPSQSSAQFCVVRHSVLSYCVLFLGTVEVGLTEEKVNFLAPPCPPPHNQLRSLQTELASPPSDVVVAVTLLFLFLSLSLTLWAWQEMFAVHRVHASY